jgi:YHS domain-containing protein
MLNNKPIIQIAFLSAIVFSGSSFAVDENNTATGLTAAGAPLGLHGIDPVAFIKIQNRIQGSATFTAVHDGVAYYFSSQENVLKFKTSPSAFIPQNGGFCTYGVSVGKKFDGNPQYADIVDDKLYVFLNEEIFNAYLKDRKGTIKKAAKNWQTIEHLAVDKL